MHDDLTIPDFFKISHDVRRAAWKGRKLTRQGSSFRAKTTKVEEAATRQLRKELEAAEVAKKVARFARLKEMAAEKAAERKAVGAPVRKRSRKRHLTISKKHR